MTALEVKNYSKSFDNVQAVDDVSFDVPENSIFGLLGRNGAGKTTTIRMLMNIYMPDSGEVTLRGQKIDSAFRKNVGYLPEERGLYKKMSLIDTLLFFAEIKGKTGKDVEKEADRYLERFDLLNRRDSKIEDLSKGNQQKIQFISTILHDPDFIILDEPFSGLDPVNTNILKEIILEKKKEGKIIIFSTHLMDFAERMCDSIALIDKGKLILSGALSDIKEQYSRKNISLSCEGDLSSLKELPFIEKISDFGQTKGIRVKEEGDSQRLLKHLVEKNIPVKSFNTNDITLHEIFIELTGEEEQEDDK